MSYGVIDADEVNTTDERRKYEEYYSKDTRYTRQIMKAAKVMQGRGRLPHTWTDIEGEAVAISGMENSHLRNTIQMLRRKASGRLLKHLIRVSDEVIDEYRDTLVDVLAYGHVDERAEHAWGEVYLDLMGEALFRSDDGDLDRWLSL